MGHLLYIWKHKPNSYTPESEKSQKCSSSICTYQQCECKGSSLNSILWNWQLGFWYNALDYADTFSETIPQNRLIGPNRQYECSHSLESELFHPAGWNLAMPTILSESPPPFFLLYCFYWCRKSSMSLKLKSEHLCVLANKLNTMILWRRWLKVIGFV